MNEQAGSFDGVAEDYLKARARYPSEMIDYVIETAGLTPASSILDVGCGSGQATMAFASRGHHVVAIDPAKRALDLLAVQCADLPGVELVHATMEQFESKHAFDLIVCAQAFHWLDPATAARRMRQLLKPHGHVMLFWHMQDVVPGSAQARLYVLSAKYFGSFPVMNPPEYAREFLDAMMQILCRDHEFEHGHIREYPWKQTYEPEMFRRLFRSSSMYSRLDEHAKPRIEDDLTDYLNSVQGAPEIAYRTCLIAAKARGDRPRYSMGQGRQP